MEIFLPDNIFARIISSTLTVEDKTNLKFLPSSLLSKHITNNKCAVGLIPLMDLLNHKDFFISKSLGVSFDESISNSYIYFDPKEKLIREITLAGDTSTNEGILTKILFNEIYNMDAQLSLEKINSEVSNKNRVVVGDRNFEEGNLDSAISFTEEMIELISAPYVNFVFASESEDLLKLVHSKYQEIMTSMDPLTIFEGMNQVFFLNSRKYLTDHLQHVVFNFDEQDLEGIKRLLELPYFHGIIQDMIDVKFV